MRPNRQVPFRAVLVVVLGASVVGPRPARAQGVVAPPRVTYPGAPVTYGYPTAPYVYRAPGRTYTRRRLIFRPSYPASRGAEPQTVANGYYTGIWDYYRD